MDIQDQIAEELAADVAKVVARYYENYPELGAHGILSGTFGTQRARPAINLTRLDYVETNVHVTGQNRSGRGTARSR